MKKTNFFVDKISFFKLGRREERGQTQTPDLFPVGEEGRGYYHPKLVSSLGRRVGYPPPPSLPPNLKPVLVFFFGEGVTTPSQTQPKPNPPHPLKPVSAAAWHFRLAFASGPLAPEAGLGLQPQMLVGPLRVS